VIQLDASKHGIGATFLQEQMAAYRWLSDKERWYATKELETLAIVWACEKFWNYIVGLSAHSNGSHTVDSTAQ